jgi:hypothetical protein
MDKNTRRSRRIHELFARLHRMADEQSCKIAGLLSTAKYLTLQAEHLMANIQELQDKIAELKDAVAADEAADADLVERLTAKIAELQAAVDANVPVDTQPLIDELEAIKASLQPAE